LDASTGQILWRRSVGYETRAFPLAIGKQPAVDALLVDGGRNEVVRVEGKTGKLVWRLAIGERFSQPVIAGARVLVTSETGTVWDVNGETGQVVQKAKFPQALQVEAGPITAAPNTYQVGSHSHIYAIGLDKLNCAEVFYLGHRAGTIVVPPVMTLNHVVVAENAGPDYALLHVLSAGPDGLGLRRPPQQEPIRVNGHIISPLVQVKNRVVAMTSLGEVKVLEIDPTNEKKPGRSVASLTKTSSRPQPSYAVVDGAQIWMGSDRFVSYDIQTSREQLNRRWVVNEQETFVAPLQRSGKTIFHARRRRGSPGVTVSAVKMDDGQAVWACDLAAPLPLVWGDNERKQIISISGQGDVFRVSKEAIDSGFLDKPAESAEVEGQATTFSFAEAQPIDASRWMLTSELDRTAALYFDPSRMNDLVQVVRADTGGAAMTAMPSVMAGALLAPLDNGQIWLLDALTGKSRILPFQPRLEPGLKVRWSRPAVFGGEQPEFVIADSRLKLYRVGIKDQPNAHLAGMSEVELPGALLTPPAVTSDTVYGVTRAADSDVVQAFPLPSLTPPKEIPLTGRLVQGPWQVGSVVLLVSDTEGLVCLGSGQELRWKSALDTGPLAGPPRLDGESLLVASLRGDVLRIGLADGKKQAETRLPGALLGSPTVYGGRLLVGGADGTLYVLPPLAGGAEQ
ncbi:MAG TPA: PQQ-binding-like beta-propeller repeat protein, partial [Pirellulaceae bacterium]|nr:PQQ-binding-like beta-propeller repeat protein [Pirellulaceae bacterium]